MKTLKIGALTLAIIFVTSAVGMNKTEAEAKAAQEAKLAGLERLPTAEDRNYAEMERRRKPFEELAVRPAKVVDAEGQPVDKLDEPLSEDELKTWKASWLRKIKAFPGACLQTIKAHPWISTGGLLVAIICAAVYRTHTEPKQEAKVREKETDDTIKLNIIVE